MKIDCVLASVNKNRMYMDCVPYFVRCWKTFYPNVDVKVILFAKKVPNNLLDISEHIILFPQIQNVYNSFASRFVTLLWPCLMNYKNGVMITHITHVPLKDNYFIESLMDYNDNVFVHFGNAEEDEQLSLLYNVAVPSTWKEIFKIHDKSNIINTLIHENTDDKNKSKKYLYDNVMKWNTESGNLMFINTIVCLESSNDVMKSQDIINSIKSKVYDVYKFPKPFTKYMHMNNFVYHLARSQITLKSEKVSIEANQILNILKNAKLAQDNNTLKNYICYYELALNNILHKGKRNSNIIIQHCMKYCDFKNQNVLDIACSNGGILIELSKDINYGCGLDSNYKQINGANAIIKYKEIKNLTFYTFNADKEVLSLVKNFIPSADIVFWFTDYYKVKKWKQLIDYIETFSKTLIIEVNNNSRDEIEYFSQKFKNVTKIYEKTPDTEVKYNNSLFICKN